MDKSKRKELVEEYLQIKIYKKDAGEIKDMRWEQKQLLKKWLEQLQPYGERGYNKPLER
jgi:hypothetical protein